MKNAFNSGWARLALILLVVWEAYLLYQWSSLDAEATRLLNEPDPLNVLRPAYADAYNASKKAAGLFFISPGIAFIAFVASRWVMRGFRKPPKG